MIKMWRRCHGNEDVGVAACWHICQDKKYRDKEMDNNGKSRITSALTHFFSLLVIDSVGYIVARTVVHTKVFRSQVGHRNRYTLH
jgi:hypothetical protein